jgi:hypothetical protein
MDLLSVRNLCFSRDSEIWFACTFSVVNDHQALHIILIGGVTVKTVVGVLMLLYVFVPVTGQQEGKFCETHQQ